MTNIPTEDQESECLANWLRANNYTFTHIANESWLPAHIARKAAIRKKRMGLSPWVPDFMIILKRWALLFIELKRCKRVLKNWTKGASPSVISDEQIKWADALNEVSNVQVEFSYGYKEAISIIKSLDI